MKRRKRSSGTSSSGGSSHRDRVDTNDRGINYDIDYTPGGRGDTYDPNTSSKWDEEIKPTDGGSGRGDTW